MRVSVAIATYNRASMVMQAAQAVLAQSLAPYEVVISDDASTDETVGLVGRLAGSDGRVKLLRQKQNSGGVANWNRAMSATSGDFIAWCSDDDRFLPGHLEASAEYLRAHPEVGLVHSGFVDAVETEAGEQRIARPLRKESVLTREGLLLYLIRYYDWPFHPSTLVMRREVWEKTGPFNAGYQFADTEWMLRVTEHFRVASLARHGVLNRRHSGNWSNRLGSAHLQRETFQMVEAAIARDFTRAGRGFWRAVWRANVRGRLALTLRARMATGHGEAALAAWHGMLQDTGRTTPRWIEKAGEAVIWKSCAGKEPTFRSCGQSVSPL